MALQLSLRTESRQAPPKQKLKSGPYVPHLLLLSTMQHILLALPAAPDRFEVITLPLPQSFSDDERVDACIRHHEKEIQSRLRMADKAEATSWSLPERIMNRRYARMILVINRFEADDDKNNDGEVAPWEEALRIEDILSGGKMHPDANRFGSYLQVQWQRREQLEDAYLDPKYISPDLSFRDFGFGVFGRTLFEMFTPAVPFYNHFVPDGVLNRQLEEARESLVDFDALTI
ncbi:uncharacterized protein GLRG_08516 [Colletotrichum graminicola M1.001]|uniref:Uncharacterized protein n=1 Tax=Colletotrichum graminicola (strain M1.001 / M2 / FGSC 10212) TaxID=645133 RepID=E3QRU9_COLGM|nr:uncharacterized protein GLRG_08516 [Colletotrichum graminicola M1.001]EFQ33587.1 hypothetical protein GLRG_08516 [Colletotrichum graminicola M1.001]